MLYKYINNTSTFVHEPNSKKPTWISFHAEAIIISSIIKSGTPHYVISIKDSSGNLEIEKILFEKYFTEKAPANDDDMFEFNSDNNKLSQAPFLKIASKYYNDAYQELISTAIRKAHTDSFIAPGSTGIININDYLIYLRTPKTINTLVELGSPFFNRRPRWAPIAQIELWERGGKPAPIGIREEDYASLKECNLIFKKLISQIFNMAEIPFVKEARDEISKLINESLPIIEHKCHYCGEKISIKLFADQQYKSKEHALNFCHKDPSEKKGRTNSKNVYIGHTRCNRIQGGLSEKARIEDGLRLLLLHDGEYITYKEIKDKIDVLFNKVKK
jgi:hypothetical protein